MRDQGINTERIAGYTAKAWEVGPYAWAMTQRSYKRSGQKRNLFFERYLAAKLLALLLDHFHTRAGLAGLQHGVVQPGGEVRDGDEQLLRAGLGP